MLEHFSMPQQHQSTVSLGQHLARRLVQIGVTDIFSVPGDSNLTLFDYFVAEPGLNLIGCCNELNAGYAADGYARSRGVGACAVTFTVGGLSLLNAIAGAYSHDLPVLCIVGGPHSNAYGSKQILHHTIGLPDFSQELNCFETITCHQAVIKDLKGACQKIDAAILTCLRESKPVYISICCDLVAIPHQHVNQEPVPLDITPRTTNLVVLEAAVEAAGKLLNESTKPVLVAGPKLRVAKAQSACVKLANASGYAFCVMPAAKGLVPEKNTNFIGTYWGAASSRLCREIVEASDASIFVGPVFDTVSSVGNTLQFHKERAIIVEPNSVTIPDGTKFGCIIMKDFLEALAKRVKRNVTAYENYILLNGDDHLLPVPCNNKSHLRVEILFKHINMMLSCDTTLVIETGDSWFHSQNLTLPQGCGFEIQLPYASIGWSINATLGYAQAAPDKRVIVCIGDGSLQMAPQDLSTMLRCGQRNVIFLINNGGYSTEAKIHDGPYNVINNWDYIALVNAMDNGQGKTWSAKVRNEDELIAAMEEIMNDRKDRLCFIEAIVDADDTSKELIKFGAQFGAASNGVQSKILH